MARSQQPDATMMPRSNSLGSCPKINFGVLIARVNEMEEGAGIEF